MFSTLGSPQLPSRQRPLFSRTNRPQPLSSIASALPTGGCQFILLHPSVTDRRCSCQGFRRNENLPGALCECGHQACYHSLGNPAAQPSAEEPVSPSTYMALFERVKSLEVQHQHDKNVLEEELKEERRARREDVRILREAMYAFYKFMDQEMPHKLSDVEDKMEDLLDRQQRLHERVITVDDSTMALEDRIAELETRQEPHFRTDNGDDSDDREDNESGDTNDGDNERVNRHTNESVVIPGRHSPNIHVDEGAAVDAGLRTGTENKNAPPKYGDIGMVGKEQQQQQPTGYQDNSLNPGDHVRPSSSLLKSQRLRPFTDNDCTIVDATLTPPTACTPVRSPPIFRRDFIFPLVSKGEISIPDYPLRSFSQSDSGCELRACVMVSRSRQPHGANADENSSRSLSSSPSSSPCRIHAPFTCVARPSNRNQLKRKRSFKKRDAQESMLVNGRVLTLPIPPPLSLSDDSSPDSMTCKMINVTRDGSPSQSYLAFASQ